MSWEVKCRSCGKTTNLLLFRDDIANALDYLDSCPQCAAELIDRDRTLLQAALRQLDHIYREAERPTEADIPPGTPENAEVYALLGVARVRLSAIRNHIDSFRKVYLGKANRKEAAA